MCTKSERRGNFKGYVFRLISGLETQTYIKLARSDIAFDVRVCVFRIITRPNVGGATVQENRQKIMAII